jgi:hypothetical protein
MAGMTDAEIIELLGGGKLGAKRFDKLRHRAKYQKVFDRCPRCGGMFVNHRCWWVARGELRPAGFDGLQGQFEV